MISGFTVARNVVQLKYPMRECLQSLRAVCDEVVLGYDPYTEDGTHELAQELSQQLDVRLFESKWDMENRNVGTEIGIQTQKTMEKCRYSWTLYCQLDEAFHEEDRDALHELIKPNSGDRARRHVTGFSFYRPYFWKDLKTIRTDWSPHVTRLVQKGTHDYTKLDGHSCKTEWGTVYKSDIWLYHYSRLGDPQAISQRIRNLDGLFHPEGSLLSKENLPDYDWKIREYDNFSVMDAPNEVEGEFTSYEGSHPKPFYNLWKDTSCF